MKIEMIGYNDTKAIAIYGSIKMLPFFIASFLIACLSLIPTLAFKIYELLYIFILPATLLFLILLQYIVNSCAKGFLEGKKIKHKFRLEDGTFYKDGKEVKSISEIRLYKFKKFLFLELKNSYYRIMNDDYVLGSRDDFLAQLRFHPRHYISLSLSSKSDDEIIDLLFKEIDIKGKEILFYSPDKTKIVYIYKNTNGSFSIGRERIIIYDEEERRYLSQYGMWEPYWGYSSISFYATFDLALNDIQNEIKGFIEFKNK